MPLFVDPRARERLTFADDCPIVELRGQWLDVRQSISNAAWQELQAGAVSAAVNQGNGSGPDWHMAFSGSNGLRRAALWIEDVSFTDGSGRRYPTQNVSDRMAWLGAMWPPAYAEVVALLDAYVARAWATTQPEPHPKAGESSDLTPPETTSPVMPGYESSGTT